MPAMKSLFFYGKGGIEIQVPEDIHCRELRSRKAIPVDDETAAVEAALDHPIASEPLLELARGKTTAAISVCDITRPAPNTITLPPLLKRLHQAGIAKENILILIATGLHRAATPEEVDIIVGPQIAADYRVVSHNARAREEHRFIGETRRGTPVYVDERFVSADLHITLGFVEQHLMLGFSGGRKLIVPGLAAQETSKLSTRPGSFANRWPPKAPSKAILSMRNCSNAPAWSATTLSWTPLLPRTARSPVSSRATR